MTLNSAHSSPSFAMRPSRKPRIILVFLIALCALFVYSYTSRLAEKSHLDALIAAEQGRIAEAKVENAILREEQAKLQQPDYLDQLARKLFGYGKPGDQLWTIIDAPEHASSSAESTVAESPVNPLDFRNYPVWRQWIVFFTAENFTVSMP
jgi:cell division protein FtsB